MPFSQIMLSVVRIICENGPFYNSTALYNGFMYMLGHDLTVTGARESTGTLPLTH